jgi:hypothetical protein
VEDQSVSIGSHICIIRCSIKHGRGGNMASKETQDLIVEAINYYMENGLCPDDKCPSMDVMRKMVKLDDIKKGLEKKTDGE